MDTQIDVVSGRSGLPIEAILMMSDSTAADLNQRLLTALQECMTERGFNVTLPPLPLPESVFSLKSRYGAVPTKDPQIWGYRDPGLSSDEPTPLPPELTDDQTEAMYGAAMVDETPDPAETQPCFPTAMQTVYGNIYGLAGLPGYADLVQLQLDSSDALYADIDALETVAQWSTCMAAAGYSFANWWEAPAAYVTDQRSTTDISPEERSTATADLGCRSSSQLETRLLDIETRIQNELLDSEQQLIEAFDASKKALASN